MHRPKLLHVTSSLRVGGAEQILIFLVQGLCDEFEQTVIYFHDGPMRLKLEELGVRTVCIKGMLCIYDPLFFLRLYALIRNERPQLIHSLLWAANVSARLVARMLAIPIISVYHNNIEQDGLLRSNLDVLTRRYADRIVAVSHEVAAPLAKRWAKIKPVAVIENGIDLAALDAIEPVNRSELGLPEDAWIVGAVGRLVPVKRFDYLVRAFALFPLERTCLVLVGAGPQEAELKALVNRMCMQDRVIFLGEVKASRYYALFDCFVQPSQKEGISLALLEAMYAEKPCIVMGKDVQHPVIMHGHTGIVIDPFQEDKLLQAMMHLYGDRQYARGLAQRARERVKADFSVSEMIHKYKKIFHNIMH